MIRLIHKIKTLLSNRNPSVSPETLDELADMVDCRRAELLAERQNS